MELSEVPAARERFDCPRDWCDGVRREHGGDGGTPSRWRHTGAIEALELGTLAQLTAEGATPAWYHIDIDVRGPYLAHQLRDLSQSLHRLAEQVSDRAAELDRLRP